MFEFIDDESAMTFKSKVTVQHPKNGKQEFTAEFGLIEQDELQELSASDQNLLEKVFVGAEGLRDADKKPLEFSAQLKAAMIKRPYIRSALAMQFMKDIQGFKRGN